MKRIIIIIFISCVAWMADASAQSANDALLFSQHYAGGTARSAGMSGAFGALGGDLSVLSANPAGLAVYRGSEISFTPALIFTNTSAKYGGNTFNETNTGFVFNNIGYSYTKNRYSDKGLQTVSFGIAYNRLSDFSSDAYVKRQNATSSLLDEFLFYANGLNSTGFPVKENDLHPFYEGLAYDTYAIDYSNDRNAYFSDYSDFGYGQPLYRSMSTRGGVGEYDISLGLNFNHTLFWGATLGIQSIYYQEKWYHDETPEFDYMNYFNFRDEYAVNGVGINFKTGVIYRPVQTLRLGAAIHTPTHCWMRPYHLTRMDTRWNISPSDDGEKRFYFETESKPSERYRMKTPWQYNLSVATVIGRFATVDADVEIVDYSKCNIMPKSIYDIENDDIQEILKTAVNVKGGAEFRLGPVYLRGGVAYYGNPYDKNGFDANIRSTLKGAMSYSGGIGFRNRDFYMDAAYSFLKRPEKINNLYLSYNATDEWYEQVKLQTITNKVIITFGFRF